CPPSADSFLPTARPSSRRPGAAVSDSTPPGGRPEAHHGIFVLIGFIEQVLTRRLAHRLPVQIVIPIPLPIKQQAAPSGDQSGLLQAARPNVKRVATPRERSTIEMASFVLPIVSMMAARPASGARSIQLEPRERIMTGSL